MKIEDVMKAMKDGGAESYTALEYRSDWKPVLDSGVHESTTEYRITSKGFRLQGFLEWGDVDTVRIYIDGERVYSSTKQEEILKAYISEIIET